MLPLQCLIQTVLSFDILLMWGPREEKPSWWEDIHDWLPCIDTVPSLQCSDVDSRLLRTYDSKWMLCWDDFYLDPLNISRCHSEASLCLVLVNKLLTYVFSVQVQAVSYTRTCPQSLSSMYVSLQQYFSSTLLSIQYDAVCFFVASKLVLLLVYFRRMKYDVLPRLYIERN